MVDIMDMYSTVCTVCMYVPVCTSMYNCEVSGAVIGVAANEVADSQGDRVRGLNWFPRPSWWWWQG